MLFLLLTKDGSDEPPKTGSVILRGKGCVFSILLSTGNIIKKCAKYANKIGLEVHAGHGMDYKTAQILVSIKEIKEFNIGHFIVGESFFYGIKSVIKKFKKIL